MHLIEKNMYICYPVHEPGIIQVIQVSQVSF